MLSFRQCKVFIYTVRGWIYEFVYYESKQTFRSVGCLRALRRLLPVANTMTNTVVYYKLVQQYQIV
jgi:hypothetical protein